MAGNNQKKILGLKVFLVLALLIMLMNVSAENFSVQPMDNLTLVNETVSIEETDLVVKNINISEEEGVIFSADILDSKWNAINAEIKLFDKETRKEYKKKLREWVKIKKGKYNIEIDLDEGPIDSIFIEDTEIDDDVVEFIRIDYIPDSEVNSTGFVKLYSIDPTPINFTSAIVNVTAAKGDKLYKCKNWDFANQECLGTWELLDLELVPGEEYSFTLTPEDPGFGEMIVQDIIPIEEPIIINETPINITNVSLIKIKDSDGLIVESDIIFIDNSTGQEVTQLVEGTYDIKIDMVEGPVDSIIINDAHLDAGTTDLIRVDDIPIEKEGEFLEVYAIDPTLIDFIDATVTVPSAKGNILYKCVDWNFTAQECYGEWVPLMSITPGQQYSFVIDAADPGLAEGSGTFFEGFEGAGYENTGWTQVGGTWDPDDNNPYTGVDNLEIRNTDALVWNEINISTVDYTNIIFSLYYETGGTFEAGEYIAAGYWNGTAWINVLNASNVGTYTLDNNSLGADAADNPDFKIRLACNVNAANEYCYWDNVQVSGTRLLTISLEDSYALNSSLGRIDGFNTSNLVDIEYAVLNFSVDSLSGNISSWYLNFTADGYSGCSLGNKQSGTCYNISSGWIQFINGTETATYDGTQGNQEDGIIETVTGSGSNFNISYQIDEHYNPNVFKWYDALYNFSDVKWQNGSNEKIYLGNPVRITLNQTMIPLDADQYKLDFRVQPNNPPYLLEAWGCNSSYITGCPCESSACRLIADKSQYELQGDGTKFRGVFTGNLIDEIGELKYIVLWTREGNQTEYFAIKTYKATAPAYTTHWEYSNNNATSWVNNGDGYETELNINWFYDGAEPTAFVYGLWVNTTTGQEEYLEGNITWDIDPSNNYLPLVGITHPYPGLTISLPYDIKFVISDPNDDNLNASLLLYQGGIFNKTIVTDMNQSNASYYWNDSTEDGDYDLVLLACELNTSDLFCVNDTHNIVISTEPPASVTNLMNISSGETWIYWNWTEPGDADFSESIVYIDGNNIVNTSNNFYNATNLMPNTYYTITVHTKDDGGNVNNTDVNNTARTLPDATPPDVTIIYPLGDTEDEDEEVSIAAEAHDISGVDTILANVTSPNGTSTVVSGFSTGLPSDNFDNDTEGVNWVKKNLTSAGQTCFVDIDGTVPGKMFIDVDGGTGPSTAHCAFYGIKRADGNFDLNLSFNITYMEDDTFFTLRTAPTDSLSAIGVRVYISLIQQSGGGKIYRFAYYNGTATTKQEIATTDTYGKLRIKRFNMTGTPIVNMYYMNNSNQEWINVLGNIRLSGSARTQFIQIKPGSESSNFGKMNMTIDNFFISGYNYTFALFNQTNQIGRYNFTIIANDTAGNVNNDETSYFNISCINDVPSRPFIEEPDVGEVINGLFNISWGQVVDEEGDSLKFNITLLNPDGTDNTTIVSAYGDANTTRYEWNTSLHADGLYDLRVTVYENETAEGNSNPDTLGGNFTIDNTPPTTTLNYPANGANFTATNNIDFNCSTTDNIALRNITFYWNYTGTWQANGTQVLTGTTDSAVFTRNNLNNGSYAWNCLAYDNASQFDWGDNNYTFTVAYAPVVNDTIAPTITLIAPDNNSVDGDGNVDFNCSAADNLNLANVSLYFNGALNQTIVTSGTSYLANFSLQNISNNLYTWYCGAYDSHGNNNISVIRTLEINTTAVPTSNNYTGNTTDWASLPDLSNVCNGTAVIDDPPEGQIKWWACVDARNQDFDANIVVSYNLIDITFGLDPSFNSSAELRIRNLTWDAPPLVYRDGVLCPEPDCSNVSYVNGVAIFNVTHFTNYTTAGNSQLEIWDQTDSDKDNLTKYPNEQIEFYANYTRKNNGQPIVGATCNINFTDVGALMTYNATSTLYEHNRSFATAGIKPYNVTCTAAGFQILTLGDSVVVTTPPNNPPYWSNNRTNIVTTYSPTTSYFNITWQDESGVDKVYFESNYSGSSQNYSMSLLLGDALNGIYGYSAILPAGSHYWKSHANDTSNQWNETIIWNFNIAKATTVLTLSANPSWTETYGTQTTVNCVADNSEVTPQLYRNGTLVSIPDVQTLGAGVYDYTCNTTATQNYTTDLTSNNLMISKATTALNLVASPDWTVLNGTITNVSCSANNNGVNISLFRNGTNVGSSVGGTISDVQNLSLGTYPYVCNNTATENYTAASASNNLVITTYIPPPVTPSGGGGRAPCTDQCEEGTLECLNHTVYRECILVDRCYEWITRFTSPGYECSEGEIIGITLPFEPETICGNRICDLEEDSDNCCLDCGCFRGYECVNNTCKEIEVALPEVEEPKEPSKLYFLNPLIFDLDTPILNYDILNLEFGESVKKVVEQPRKIVLSDDFGKNVIIVNSIIIFLLILSLLLQIKKSKVGWRDEAIHDELERWKGYKNKFRHLFDDHMQLGILRRKPKKETAHYILRRWDVKEKKKRPWSN